MRSNSLTIERIDYRQFAMTAAITASIGVAQHRGQDLDKLMSQADHALYRAKQNGRNCTCLYDANLDD